MQSPPDHEDEIKFAKALVNPEKDSRDKTLAKLRKYAASIKTFDDMEMLKLWKALYYTMWLSDKQVIQAELAQSLTDLTQAFSTVELQLLYVRMFFRILMREWFHLDQYRVNKFYSLIRLMFRNTLSMALKVGWSSETATTLLNIVDVEVLHKKPNGVRFHIADIFLTELHNVTGGKISTKDFMIVLQPFLSSVLRLDDNNVYIERVYKEVLTKFATTFAAENFSEDVETETPVFAGVNTKVIQKTLFSLAAEEDTPPVCRKKLYELHKVFATATKTSFITESVEDMLAADASLTKSAVAAAAKKEKKRAAAAAGVAEVPVAVVPVPVVAVATTKTSKKESKEVTKELTKEVSAKKAEKAVSVPVVEKEKEKVAAAPVAVAEEGTKKKKKRAAEEESAPAEVPKEEKKAKKSEKSDKSDKTEKSEKTDKTEKPKVKKAKTEGSDEAAAAPAAAVVAAPKVDTPPPQYIASAKFAGRKVGYAFKKGASGIGYYWDAVQARKLARAGVASSNNSSNTPSKQNSASRPSSAHTGSGNKHAGGNKRR